MGFTVDTVCMNRLNYFKITIHSSSGFYAIPSYDKQDEALDDMAWYVLAQDRIHY